MASVATLWAALAPSYEQLFVARLVTATAQALFWAAVVPATTGLFRPVVRGRAMARLALGNSLAPVLGVPAGTWLGEHTSWRWTFAAVAALSLVVTFVVLALFPTMAPSEGGASRAPHPSARRFGFQMVTTGLVLTGAFGVITFVTQYFIDVTGFAQADMARLLLLQGAAGVVGTIVVGRFIDARPVAVLLVALAVLSVALASLWAFGESPVVAVAALALFGFSFSCVPPALSHRVMLVAPGSTNMGVAISSSMFNVGIAAGSGLGAALVAAVDVRVVRSRARSSCCWPCSSPSPRSASTLRWPGRRVRTRPSRRDDRERVRGGVDVGQQPAEHRLVAVERHPGGVLGAEEPQQLRLGERHGQVRRRASRAPRSAWMRAPFDSSVR